MEEGFSAKGIFGGSATGGRAFRAYRRRTAMDATQRFAELLSQHIDEDDLAAGRNLATGQPLPPGAKLDPGGNVVSCSQRMGVRPGNGNAMLQRIRRKLGPQAS